MITVAQGKAWKHLLAGQPSIGTLLPEAGAPFQFLFQAAYVSIFSHSFILTGARNVSLTNIRTVIPVLLMTSYLLPPATNDYTFKRGRKTYKSCIWALLFQALQALTPSWSHVFAVTFWKSVSTCKQLCHCWTGDLILSSCNLNLAALRE